MPIFLEPWFWIFLIAVFLSLFTLIFFLTFNSQVWVLLLLLLTLFIFVISLTLYIKRNNLSPLEPKFILTNMHFLAPEMHEQERQDEINQEWGEKHLAFVDHAKYEGIELKNKPLPKINKSFVIKPTYYNMNEHLKATQGIKSIPTPNQTPTSNQTPTPISNQLQVQKSIQHQPEIKINTPQIFRIPTPQTPERKIKFAPAISDCDKATDRSKATDCNKATDSNITSTQPSFNIKAHISQESNNIHSLSPYPL